MADPATDAARPADATAVPETRGTIRSSLANAPWRKMLAWALLIPVAIFLGLAAVNYNGVLIGEQQHNYHVLDEASSTLASWPGTIQQIARTQYYGSHFVQTDGFSKQTNPNIGSYKIVFDQNGPKKPGNCYYDADPKPKTRTILNTSMQVDFENSNYVGGGLDFVVHGYVARKMELEPHHQQPNIDTCFTSRVPFSRLVTTDMNSDDTLASHVLILDRFGKVIAQAGNANLTLEGIPPSSLVAARKGGSPPPQDGEAPRSAGAGADTVNVKVEGDDSNRPERPKRNLSTDIDSLRGNSAIGIADSFSITVHGAEYQAYIRPLRIPNTSIPACDGVNEVDRQFDAGGQQCYVAVLFPKQALTQDWLKSSPILRTSILFGIIALGLAVPIIRFLLIGEAESINRFELASIAVCAPALMIIGVFGILLTREVAINRSAGQDEIQATAKWLKDQTFESVKKRDASIREFFNNLNNINSPGKKDFNLKNSCKYYTANSTSSYVDYSCFTAITSIGADGFNADIESPETLSPGSIPKTSKVYQLYSSADEAGTIYNPKNGKDQFYKISSLTDIRQREYFQIAQQIYNQTAKSNPQSKQQTHQVFTNFSYVRSQSSGIDVGIVLAYSPSRTFSLTPPGSPPLAQNYLLGSFVLPSLVAPILPSTAHFAVVNTMGLTGDARRLPIIAHDQAGFVSNDSFIDDARLPDDAVRRILALPRHPDEPASPCLAERKNEGEPLDFKASVAGKFASFAALAVPCTPWVVLTWQNQSDIDKIASDTATFALIDVAAIAVLILIGVAGMATLMPVAVFTLTQLSRWTSPLKTHILNVMNNVSPFFENHFDNLLNIWRISLNISFAFALILFFLFYESKPNDGFVISSAEFLFFIVFTISLLATSSAVSGRSILDFGRNSRFLGHMPRSGRIWWVMIAVCLPLAAVIWLDAQNTAILGFDQERAVEALHDLRDRDRILLHSVLPATQSQELKVDGAITKTPSDGGKAAGQSPPPETASAPETSGKPESIVGGTAVAGVPTLTQRIENFANGSAVQSDHVTRANPANWLTHGINPEKTPWVARSPMERFSAPDGYAWYSFFALVGLAALAWAARGGLGLIINALCIEEKFADATHEQDLAEALKTGPDEKILEDQPKLILMVANGHEPRKNLRLWAFEKGKAKGAGGNLVDLADVLNRMEESGLDEASLRNLQNEAGRLRLPAPDNRVFGNGETVVIEGLTLLMPDTRRRRAALVLLEYAARMIRTGALGRVIVMAETTPMERIVDQFARETDGSTELNHDFEMEELRWARLFQKFKTVIQKNIRFADHVADCFDQAELDETQKFLVSELGALPRDVVETIFSFKYEGDKIKEHNLILIAHWKGQSKKAVCDFVRDYAAEYYEQLWFSSTRWERVLLDSLARHHYVNLKRAYAIGPLVRQGIIVASGPVPQLFNASFAEFVKQAERPTRIEAWRSELPKGQWQLARVGILGVTALVLGTHAYALVAEGADAGSIFATLLAGAPALINALIRPGSALKSELK